VTLALTTLGVGAAHALSLTTEGVLTPLRTRIVLRPEALAADVLELLTNIRAVLARADQVLTDETSTSRDLRQLEADLGANLEALREFRVDLDAWRAIDALPVVDAAALIRLWRWDRALRRALIGLAGQLRTVTAMARELAAGRADRVVVVRSGDSWQKLAQEHLGDWQAWRALVEHNAGDPAGPTSGQLIAIPRASTRR